MEPNEYLSALRKRWLAIIIVGLLGAGAGIALAVTATPTYKATSKVFVALTRGDTVTELVQGSTYTQNLVESYAQLATMPVVLDPVVAKLALHSSSSNLAKSVSADTPLNTVIIQITAVDKSPAGAARIANAVAAQLAITVQSVSPKNASKAAAVKLRTVAPAQAPTASSTPNVPLLVGTGLALGLALGVVFALARAALDTKIRTIGDVARVTDIAVLGAVGFERGPGKEPFVMQPDSHSPRAEAYRRLRTNLQFLDVARRVHSLVVTSALPTEGKTTTAINLALALAEGSTRVVLVDADFRLPTVAQFCGLEGSAGLTTVLIGQATLDDVLQPWGSPNVDILPAGQVPPNPSQLLASPAMNDVLEQLRERYDIVILDSAPLLPVADTTILARATDGALVVAGCRKVTRPQLAAALGTLDAVGATCLGLVVNQIPRSDTGGYYQYETPSPRAQHPRTRSIAHPLARSPKRAADVESGQVPDPMIASKEPS